MCFIRNTNVPFLYVARRFPAAKILTYRLLTQSFLSVQICVSSVALPLFVSFVVHFLSLRTAATSAVYLLAAAGQRWVSSMLIRGSLVGLLVAISSLNRVIAADDFLGRPFEQWSEMLNSAQPTERTYAAWAIGQIAAGRAGGP